MLKRLKSKLKKYSIVKQLISGYYRQRDIYSSNSFFMYLYHNFVLLHALLICKANKKSYEYFSKEQLLKTRTSDIAFVFGSGYSLNDINQDCWDHFALHDTIGFSGFVHQSWVPVKYHLIREWYQYRTHRLHNIAVDYTNFLNNNPLFDESILIMQAEHSAYFCNHLVGYDLIKHGLRVFPYKTVKSVGLPSESFDEGLRHVRSCLYDTINFAFLMGYKEIVLTGVDLYDSRYFWVAPDKTERYDYEQGEYVQSPFATRGQGYSDKHNTVKNGVIDQIAKWNDFFVERGVRLSVYNPKSLLTEVLPIYEAEINTLG